MGVENKDFRIKRGMPRAANEPTSMAGTLFSDLLAELEIPADTAPTDPAPALAETSRVLVCTAALESIGHLQKKIESQWGSQELDVFINGLFVDSRDGVRVGLPLEVAAELVFLAGINKMIRALDTAKQLKLSYQEAYRLVDEGDQSRLEAAQRPAAQQPTMVFASRREKSADGFLTRLWQHLFAPGGSNFMAYLVVAAVGGMLWWLWISGFIPGVPT